MTYEQWENHWKDYYKILEIDRNANEKTIKKKYRKLMAKYHPDMHINDSEEEQKQFEEKAKEIAEAYEILSNPEKKKKYDAAWDEVKKTGTYTGQRQNTDKSENNNQASNNNSNNQDSNNEDFTNAKEEYTYEESQKEYTAEEKKYAKRLALEEIIKQELEKIDIIIKAKNELLYKGYSSEIDKREYYTSAKELIAIGYEFINNLNKLAEEAFKYDLLEEEERIYDSVANLESILTSFPLTPADARRKLTEIIYKEKIKEQLLEEINNSKESIEKLNSVLIYTGRGEITHVDYNNILNNILFEAKDCKSKLNELIRLAKELEINGIEEAIEGLKKLSSKIDSIPNDFETAKKLGVILNLSETLKELLNECALFENKMMKLLKVLQKHPNSKYFEQVCLTSIKRIEEKIEELNTAKAETSHSSNQAKIITEKAKQYSKEAVMLYNNATKLHQEAEEVYKEKVVHINGWNYYEAYTKDLLKEDAIITLSKSVASIFDKSKAFDIFIENEVLMEKVKKLQINNLELNQLLNKLINKIENLERIIYTLKQFLEKYKVRKATQQNTQTSTNTNSKSTQTKTSPHHLDALKIEELQKLLSEITEKIKSKLYDTIVSIGVTGLASIYPVVKTLDGKPNTGLETLLSIILACCTAGGLNNTYINLNNYLELKSQEAEVNNVLTQKLIKESYKHR